MSLEMLRAKLSLARGVGAGAGAGTPASPEGEASGAALSLEETSLYLPFSPFSLRTGSGRRGQKRRVVAETQPSGKEVWECMVKVLNEQCSVRNKT